MASVDGFHPYDQTLTSKVAHYSQRLIPTSCEGPFLHEILRSVLIDPSSLRPPYATLTEYMEAGHLGPEVQTILSMPPADRLVVHCPFLPQLGGCMMHR